ncbi:MAG: PKD domain-containing protein [Planctomycetota bacterium]
MYKSKLVSHILLLSCLILVFAGHSVAGPLTVHPSNPRYFGDGSGKAIYMTGSHNWSNFQDMGWNDPPTPIDYSGHIDWLAGLGHNFSRGWNWEQARWVPWDTGNVYINPLPFARTGPGTALDGKPQFDLTQFNQTGYFDRIRDRAIEAGNHGIYMGIMLFEGWSVEKPFASTPGNPWPGHPMNANNNINGINGNPNLIDGLDGIEIHTLQVPAITTIQENYVKKCIDTLNDLDNIIWEIGNEIHQSSVTWQYHMIDFIHSYEANKPKQHLVWMTASAITNAQVDASNAEVVSYTHNGWEALKTDPPATTGSKIVLLDTDHLWGVGGDRDWFWKSFTRGYNPIYMDPIIDLPGYDGLNPGSPSHNRCRNAMGYTLSYANRMNMANVIPQPSTTSTPCSTKYCLYDAGEEYLIYQSTSGAFTVNFPAGSYDYEWFNLDNGTVVSEDSLIWSGGSRSFTPPISGDVVLFLRKGGRPNAVIDANPTIGYPPLMVNFDGSNSTDIDGIIVSYEWDFTNDGSIDQTGQVTSHQYDVANEYTASLKVTDDIGLTDTATVNISVVYPLGDFDRDFDVDQEDFGHFQECMTGTGNPQNDPECLDARFDVDTDVDLDDFNIFNECMDGPNVQPANPNCIGP